MTRPTATEKQLMDALIATALQLGYLVMHIPDRLYALAAGQGRYDTLAGAKGFPDLIIAGYGRLFVIECKSATGTVDPEQQAWLREIESVESDRVHVLVARPVDQNDIMDRLVQYREESWKAA